MMKNLIAAAALSLAAVSTANAGGFLTNTNQNAAFLRNPARDGAISIDGIYSNPAGVAFLEDGIHLSVNWQGASQKRKIMSENQYFHLGKQNNGLDSKQFVGKAVAPFIPSVQAAYNKDKWSFQFGFAVTGGGGKCEFSEGLGSFESVIAGKAASFGQLNALQQLQQLGVPGVAGIPSTIGYDMNSYLQGKQYYFGFTLGTAYKITENLSVYGGLRVLYGSASYKAKISDIMVNTAENGYMPLEKYVGAVSASMTEAGTFASKPANQQAMVAGLTAKLMSAGMPADQALAAATAKVTDGLTGLQAAATELSTVGEALSPYLKDGVNLQSDQSGVGFAPVFGIDYKVGNFNFAGKYEFRTKMSMKNKSTVKEASVIPAVNKFQDGASIREDAPAMLAFGAQWTAIPGLRITAGYHHFYDTESKKYMDEQLKLDGGSNEYLGGVEYDLNKKLTLSSGFQITRFGNTDEFMSDMSFNVNSWSLGGGVKYQVSERVALNAALFSTFYGDYEQAVPDANGTKNTFTRTNVSFGLGADFKF